MQITTENCESAGEIGSSEMLKRRPSGVRGDISPADQPLLIGLTALLRPQKVVEIGIASGWSGCLFLDTLIKSRQPAEYIGIDFSKYHYLDKSRPTGAAITALFPKLPVGSRLLLGAVAIDFLPEIGTGVGLALIDGDHLHPWATLDLLSLLPALAPSAYVLLHDINLSLVERHRHRNRGPKYLFDSWPLAKIHSSQKPSMIGAIQMPSRMDDSILNLLLDTLYTPWEISVEPLTLSKIAGALSQAYGEEWGGKFAAAFTHLNFPGKAEDGEVHVIRPLVQQASARSVSASKLADKHVETAALANQKRMVNDLGKLAYELCLDGLKAVLQGEELVVTGKVTNKSESDWPTRFEKEPVLKVGGILYSGIPKAKISAPRFVIEQSFFRKDETIPFQLRFATRGAAVGKCEVMIDLLYEDILWFESRGGSPEKITLDLLPAKVG